MNIQWNPDFSNTRLFETPDSSNQKSFPLDLLHSNTVILPPIFRLLDFSKLPIIRTNSFFLSKIYIRFLELWKLRNQQKPVLATYTPECMQLTSSGEGVFMHFLFTKQVTKLSLKSSWRNYNAVVTQSRVLNYCTWSKFLRLVAFFKLLTEHINKFCCSFKP